jgi:hypothetical protein
MKVGAVLVIVVVTTASIAGARQMVWQATSKETDRGVEMAEGLIKTRSRLAATHVKPKVSINEDTARKICIEVAKKAEEFAEGNKIKGQKIYAVRFPTERPRNPVNAADESEAQTLRFFDENRDKKEHWHGVWIDERQYYRYMKPIFAGRPCLSCHGDEKKRPAFIKKMYPDDKSFGFKEGDIMGGVAVFTLKKIFE